MSEKPQVSIIIPAFNEEGNVAELFERIAEGFRLAGGTGETVFVDDGSTDSTWARVEEACKAHPGIVPVRHRRNLGLSEALNTGFRNVSGDHVIFLPADLQSDPAEDIPTLHKALCDDHDVVVGWRIGRREGKLFVSLIYNFLCRHLFGLDAHDLNWIKGFRREVIQEIHLRSDWHRYIVILAAQRGFRVKEVRTPYHPRHSGRSKFGRKRIMRGLLDLLVVKFELSFTDKPMLLFGSWGLGFVGLGAGIGLALLALRVWTGVGNRPLLFLVMLLVLVGVQLLGLGFVAEQIASLRESVRERRRAEDSDRAEAAGDSWKH